MGGGGGYVLDGKINELNWIDFSSLIVWNNFTF